MARPSCTLSTSNPRSSVERLSFIRRRTSSVTRLSSSVIFFVIEFRRSPPCPPGLPIYPRPTSSLLLSSPPFTSLHPTSLGLTSFQFSSLLTKNQILKTKNSVRRQPPIQRNRRPCEPSRLLRSQKHRHLRNVFRPPQAAQRNRRQPLLQHRLSFCCFVKNALHQIRFHHRWANAIHTDLFMRVIDRHGFRQHGHAAFRRTIRRSILHCKKPQHRANINDRSPAAFSKLPQHRPRHQERPLYIDRHHPVPLFFADPLHRRYMQRSCIVHQHIQPPESLHGSFHRALDVPRAGHIALHRQSRPAPLLHFADHLSKLFQPSSRHRHTRAFPRKRQRDRSPYPRTSACDQRHLA